MFFFFPDTVGEDMRLAGKPESGGVLRVASQRLFGYTKCILNETE